MRLNNAFIRVSPILETFVNKYFDKQNEFDLKGGEKRIELKA